MSSQNIINKLRAVRKNLFNCGKNLRIDDPQITNGQLIGSGVYSMIIALIIEYNKKRIIIFGERNNNKLQILYHENNKKIITNYSDELITKLIL